MPAKWIAALCFVLPMSSAFSTESAPLCSAPLDPDCVDPKWGMIDPVDGDASLVAPSTLAGTAGSADLRVAIRPAVAAPAARSSAASPGTLKAVIDGTKRFARETARLTGAVKKARFDRDGTIVSGEAEIAAAAEAARKVASNFALTLYIRVPASLKPDTSAALTKKIASINGVLKPSGKDSDYPGKPRS